MTLLPYMADKIEGEELSQTVGLTFSKSLTALDLIKKSNNTSEGQKL